MFVYKTQDPKRKIWQDGRLILTSSAARQAILHAAHPPPGGGDPALCQCELTPVEYQGLTQQQQQQHCSSDTRLETERFLIQIEGPWVGNTGTSNSTTHFNPKPAKLVSNGMQKILKSKFITNFSL